MQILIRDMPDEVVSKLDAMAKKKGYASRQQLILEILTRYSEVGEESFVDVLPIVTRTLIRGEIHSLTDKSDEVMLAMENLLYKLLIATQKIDTYITGDYSK